MPDTALHAFLFDTLEPFLGLKIRFVGVQIVERIRCPERRFEILACPVERVDQVDDSVHPVFFVQLLKGGAQAFV